MSPHCMNHSFDHYFIQSKQFCTLTKTVGFCPNSTCWSDVSHCCQRHLIWNEKPHHCSPWCLQPPPRICYFISNNELVFTASDMTLFVQSDASYRGRLLARSVAVGCFYLSPTHSHQRFCDCCKQHHWRGCCFSFRSRIWCSIHHCTSWGLAPHNSCRVRLSPASHHLAVWQRVRGRHRQRHHQVAQRKGNWHEISLDSRSDLSATVQSSLAQGSEQSRWLLHQGPPCTHTPSTHAFSCPHTTRPDKPQAC